VIDGPWAAPRIYPDVAGILDNPDAAYAKLKEIGSGLFGPGGLGNGSDSNPSGGGQSDTLGSQLGDTLGNLIQQGLGSGRPRNNPSAPAPNNPPAPAQPDQGGRSANDILHQLFGR
jgi:AsmA protein